MDRKLKAAMERRKAKEPLGSHAPVVVGAPPPRESIFNPAARAVGNWLKRQWEEKPERAERFRRDVLEPAAPRAPVVGGKEFRVDIPGAMQVKPPAPRPTRTVMRAVPGGVKEVQEEYEPIERPLPPSAVPLPGDPKPTAPNPYATDPGSRPFSMARSDVIRQQIQRLINATDTPEEKRKTARTILHNFEIQRGLEDRITSITRQIGDFATGSAAYKEIYGALNEMKQRGVYVTPELLQSIGVTGEFGHERQTRVGGAASIGTLLGEKVTPSDAPLVETERPRMKEEMVGGGVALMAQTIALMPVEIAAVANLATKGGALGRAGKYLHEAYGATGAGRFKGKALTQRTVRGGVQAIVPSTTLDVMSQSERGVDPLEATTVSVVASLVLGPVAENVLDPAWPALKGMFTATVQGAMRAGVSAQSILAAGKRHAKNADGFLRDIQAQVREAMRGQKTVGESATEKIGDALAAEIPEAKASVAKVDEIRAQNGQLPSSDKTIDGQANDLATTTIELTEAQEEVRQGLVAVYGEDRGNELFQASLRLQAGQKAARAGAAPRAAAAVPTTTETREVGPLEAAMDGSHKLAARQQAERAALAAEAQLFDTWNASANEPSFSPEVREYAGRRADETFVPSQDAKLRGKAMDVPAPESGAIKGRNQQEVDDVIDSFHGEERAYWEDRRRALEGNYGPEIGAYALRQELGLDLDAPRQQGPGYEPKVVGVAIRNGADVRSHESFEGGHIALIQAEGLASMAGDEKWERGFIDAAGNFKTRQETLDFARRREPRVVKKNEQWGGGDIGADASDFRKPKTPAADDYGAKHGDETVREKRARQNQLVEMQRQKQAGFLKQDAIDKAVAGFKEDYGHYPEGYGPGEERIVNAAIQNKADPTDVQDGPLGPGHWGVWDRVAAERGLDARDSAAINEWTDGFRTSTGRFVDRFEAMEIARASEQIDPDMGYPEKGGQLGSEDVLPDEFASPRQEADRRSPPIDKERSMGFAVKRMMKAVREGKTDQLPALRAEYQERYNEVPPSDDELRRMTGTGAKKGSGFVQKDVETTEGLYVPKGATEPPAPPVLSATKEAIRISPNDNIQRGPSEGWTAPEGSTTNIELASPYNENLSYERLGALADEDRAALRRQALAIAERIIQREGLTGKVSVSDTGAGQWSELGWTGVNDGVRVDIDPSLDVPTVQRALAALSKGMKQKAFFASIPSETGGRMALSLEFGRPLTVEEYRKVMSMVMERMGGPQTFQGSTLVKNSPVGVVQIVLPDGATEQFAKAVGEEIAALMPDERVAGEFYGVQVVEGNDANNWVEELGARGLQEGAALDSETDNAWESLARDAGERYERRRAAVLASEQQLDDALALSDRARAVIGEAFESPVVRTVARVGGGLTFAQYAADWDEDKGRYASEVGVPLAMLATGRVGGVIPLRLPRYITHRGSIVRSTVDVARELIRASATSAKRIGKSGILLESQGSLFDAKPVERVARIVKRGMKEMKEILEHADKAVREGGAAWYRDVKKMDAETIKLFPELKDPSRLTIFKAILARTSAGLDPVQNYRQAAQIYENWRFGEGGYRLSIADSPWVPGSVQQKGHEAWLAALEAIWLDNLDRVHGDLDEAARMTADDLMGFHEVPTRGGKGEPKRVLNSVAFLGPKTGRFFQNLMGNLDEVTVDIWATRTARRYMGYHRLEVVKDDAKRPQLTDNGDVLYKLEDTPNETERKIIQQAFEEIARRSKPELGKAMKPADIQGALWYWEKNIYREAGAADSGLSDYSHGVAAYREWQADRATLATKANKAKTRALESDPAIWQTFLDDIRATANQTMGTAQAGVGPAFQVLVRTIAKHPGVVSMGAVGYYLENLDENEHKYWQNAGPWVMGLALLSAIGSKNLAAGGGKIGQALVEQLRKSRFGEDLVFMTNPGALLSPDMKKAIAEYERTVAEGVAKAKEMSEKLKKLGGKADRLVSDLREGEGWEDLSKMTGAEIAAANAAVAELSNIINPISAKLYSLGFLTDAEFARHEQTYMKRVYAEWDALDVMRSHGRQQTSSAKVRAGKTKRRKIDEPIYEAEAELSAAVAGGNQAEIQAALDKLDNASLAAFAERLHLGEIRESSYRAAQTIEEGYRNVASLTLFNTLRNMPGVIEPSYLNAVNDFIAKRTAWKAATGAAKAQAKADMDAAFVSMVDMRRSFEPDKRETAWNSRSEYIVLPDTASMGVMRGMVVRREMANELEGLPDIRGIGKTMRAWKIIKTAFNIPTGIANLMSNGVMAHTGGLMSLSEQGYWLARAMKDMRSYGPGTRALAETGNLNTNAIFDAPAETGVGKTRDFLEDLSLTTRPETQKVLGERGIKGKRLVRRIDEEWGAGKLQGLGARKLWQTGTKLYNNGDNIYRVAGYLKATEAQKGAFSKVPGGHGLTPDEGIEKVLGTFGDFRTRSPLLHVMRSTIFPFILWPAKALPAFAKGVIDHPWRYVTLVASLGLLDEMSQQTEGEVPERDIPERERRKAGYFFPGFTQLPWSRETGEKAAIDPSRWFPTASLTTAVPPGSVPSELFGPNTPAMLQPGGPIINVGSKLAVNKDPFTGDPYYHEDYGTKYNIGKALEIAGDEVSPAMLGFHRRRLVKDYKNRDFDAMLNDALGATVGLRSRYVRPGANIRSAVYQFKSFTSEEKQRLSRELLAVGGRNPERSKEFIDRYIARVNNASQSFQRKMGQPVPPEDLKEALDLSEALNDTTP